MLAHAALGNLFDLPVVMTTSSDAGPNGLMIKEVVDLNPNVTIVHRQGEVNAWDNAEFRAAVKATGKKQLIIGGIVTEVCTFPVSSIPLQRRV
jgi:isochorismate hydrolase